MSTIGSMVVIWPCAMLGLVVAWLSYRNMRHQQSLHLRERREDRERDLDKDSRAEMTAMSLRAVL